MSSGDGSSYVSIHFLILCFIMFRRTDIGLWQYNTLIQLSIICDHMSEDGREVVLEVDGQEFIICKTM